MAICSSYYKRPFVGKLVQYAAWKYWKQITHKNVSSHRKIELCQESKRQAGLGVDNFIVETEIHQIKIKATFYA